MLIQIVKFALLCTGVVLAGGCSSTAQDSNANAAATTPTEVRASARPRTACPTACCPCHSPAAATTSPSYPRAATRSRSATLWPTRSTCRRALTRTTVSTSPSIRHDRNESPASCTWMRQATGRASLANPAQSRMKSCRRGRPWRLVTAITNQPILDVSEPVTAELGGARGLYLEVRIPKDYNASRCGDGEIGLVGRSGMIRNALPGYVGTWWVLNVDGERILVQPYCPGPCPDNSTEHLNEVAETITFTKLG